MNNEIDYSGHLDEIEKRLVTLSDSLIIDMGIVHSLPVTQNISQLLEYVATKAAQYDKYITWIRANRSWALQCLENFLVTHDKETTGRYDITDEEVELFCEIYGDSKEHH